MNKLNMVLFINVQNKIAKNPDMLNICTKQKNSQTSLRIIEN